jgi:ribosomal protein S18 acetylase RimI-like enzyme
MLEVRVSNEIAQHIYEHAGFKATQIKKDYYEAKLGREDGILMGKLFSAPGEKSVKSMSLS